MYLYAKCSAQCGRGVDKFAGASCAVAAGEGLLLVNASSHAESCIPLSAVVTALPLVASVADLPRVYTVKPVHHSQPLERRRQCLCLRSHLPAHVKSNAQQRPFSSSDRGLIALDRWTAGDERERGVAAAQCISPNEEHVERWQQTSVPREVSETEADEQGGASMAL